MLTPLCQIFTATTPLSHTLGRQFEPIITRESSPMEHGAACTASRVTAPCVITSHVTAARVTSRSSPLCRQSPERRLPCKAGDLQEGNTVPILKKLHSPSHQNLKFCRQATAAAPEPAGAPPNPTPRLPREPLRPGPPLWGGHRPRGAGDGSLAGFGAGTEHPAQPGRIPCCLLLTR